MEPSPVNHSTPDTIDNHHPSQGSLEKGVAGDYLFSVRAILRESWEKTKGAKLAIHLGYLVVFAVSIALILASAVLFFFIGPENETAGGAGGAVGMVMQLALTAVCLPMWAGLTMIGIRRAVDQPLSYKSPLQYFHKTLPMIAMYILMTIFMVIGFLLLIIPGIYLMMAYMLSYPLMVEKNLGIWSSMETSRRAITHRWFRFTGLFFILGLLNIIALIPLGIGLIWTIPMTHVAIGIAYRNMFGVETDSNGMSA